MSKFLKKAKANWYEYLWLGAPVALWFSYQPVIKIGQSAIMNLELSIALIYLFILALGSLIAALPSLKQLFRYKSVWLVTAFTLLASLSVVWAPNTLRAVLTAGVIVCIYLVFLGALAHKERLVRSLPKLLKVTIIVSAAMALLVFVQFFAGIWLVYGQGLLCAGCVSDQFGFVRPNLFAIEPQFLGSLFLPGALLLASLILQKKQRWYVWAAFCLVVAALLLTLSRGALFAFLAGLMVLAVIHRGRLKRLGMTAVLLVGVFISVTFMQGLASVMNPRIEETFLGAASKSINQLSLGVIKLPVVKNKPAAPSVVPTVVDEAKKEKPAYSGYVEESTTIRLKFSDYALQTWQRAPWLEKAFGVGVGGAGIAMNRAFPEVIDAKEIVQNQYIEVLLEMGLIGFVLFFGSIIGLLIITLKRVTWTWGLVAAFMVQWATFSGYPNALHIYVALIVIAVVAIQRHGGLKLAK